MYVHTCMRARVCTCVCRVCATVCNVCVSLRACVRACATVCVSLRANVHASLPVGRKRAWGGREPGAEGSMGRTGAWGGQEPGALGCLGRQGAWGAREPGADLEGSLSREVGAPGSLERKGAWGGRDPQWAGREAATGAGRGLGRKGVWGGREPGAGGCHWAVWGASSMRGGPSVHTLTHQPPLAPSRYDISQPAGRHLPYTNFLDIIDPSSETYIGL